MKRPEFSEPTALRLCLTEERQAPSQPGHGHHVGMAPGPSGRQGAQETEEPEVKAGCQGQARKGTPERPCGADAMGQSDGPTCSRGEGERPSQAERAP